MTNVVALEPITKTPRELDGSTRIEIVLDETGSMSAVTDETISSFNEFLDSQKNVAGEASVSLTMFSQKYGSSGISYSMRRGAPNVTAEVAASVPNIRNLYENVAVKEVPRLNRENYVPDGGTNLYDAIGTRIASVRASLAGKDKIPSVLFVIVTDGQENASVEYRDLNLIRTMIQECEQEGWTFIYLGANQNAWEVGRSFGLSAAQTMTYDVSNLEAASASLSAATTRYRDAYNETYTKSGGVMRSAEAVSRSFFSDEEQDVRNG